MIARKYFKEAKQNCDVTHPFVLEHEQVLGSPGTMWAGGNFSSLRRPPGCDNRTIMWYGPPDHGRVGLYGSGSIAFWRTDEPLEKSFRSQLPQSKTQPMIGLRITV